jgi:hypothetical protein
MKTCDRLPESPIDKIITAPECLTPRARVLETYDLIISWDTEYVERENNGHRYNDILSYQFTALHHTNNGWTYAEGILYPPGPEVTDRLRLSDLLRAVLNVFNIGRRQANTLNALLLTHFGVAEWAALRDRNRIAEKYLTSVREVPVSFRPFTLPVHLGSNNYAKVRLTMRDTMLLAPEKQQSLRDLATVTVHKKLELADYEITHMDQLLTIDPRRYEAYAINDARVTLEYYLLFMQEYEHLFGVVNLPLTLGDAAVKAYEHALAQHHTLSHQAVFGYEDATVKTAKGHVIPQQKKTFYRAISDTLAAHAYHGGENLVPCQS